MAYAATAVLSSATTRVAITMIERDGLMIPSTPFAQADSSTASGDVNQLHTPHVYPNQTATSRCSPPIVGWASPQLGRRGCRSPRASTTQLDNFGAAWASAACPIQPHSSAHYIRTVGTFVPDAASRKSGRDHTENNRQAVFHQCSERHPTNRVTPMALPYRSSRGCRRPGLTRLTSARTQAPHRRGHSACRTLPRRRHGSVATASATRAASRTRWRASSVDAGGRASPSYVEPPENTDYHSRHSIRSASAARGGGSVAAA